MAGCVWSWIVVVVASPVVVVVGAVAASPVENNKINSLSLFAAVLASFGFFVPSFVCLLFFKRLKISSTFPLSNRNGIVANATQTCHNVNRGNTNEAIASPDSPSPSPASTGPTLVINIVQLICGIF